MNILGNELNRKFEQVQPMDFYREIFPRGELAPWREGKQKDYNTHDYTGIIVRIKKDHVERYTVTDDLDAIDGVLWDKEKDFCIMSPISYAGKSRKSTNARFMYALVIEIDNLQVKNRVQVGLSDLLHQISKEKQPRPTYIVASGNGLHLYYVFKQPVPMFKNVTKEMAKYKRELTYRLWNKFVTRDYQKDKVQQESIFQGFRMVGTVTKKGDTVEAYKTGDKVDIEYLNGFVREKYRINPVYKNDLPLARAKELYPDWYERRVVNGEPKGHWICNRAVYDWWLERIEFEATVGHRYYCMMMLCIYAIKCDISQEELEKDCLKLMKQFEDMTNCEDNHFTKKDVMDALQAFEDKGFITYPINSISNRSGLEIYKNKRNGRRRQEHLQAKYWKNENGRPIINSCKENRELSLQYMRDSGEIKGRPKGSSREKNIIIEWRKNNPDKRKADCIRETGFDKKTVYRWWNAEPEIINITADYMEGEKYHIGEDQWWF